LDGWKAIAAHFRRDRTTVMRWAAERGLPVYRMPGGKQSSVFAYEDELQDWSAKDKALMAPEVLSQDVQTPQPPSGIARHAKWLLLGALLLTGASLPIAFSPMFGEKSGIAVGVPDMPRSQEAAADYVTARDLWARRTPEDLKRSIALFEVVIAREDDFAPAYAGLADAWLVFREYGDIGEAEAYGKASAAADKALRLDPDLAAAHRARGFIAYWWHYDANRSLASFERALELDQKDGLTHFWYANVLSDIGKHDAALREYNIAQLLLPGTPAITVERACALWQAGNDRAAIAELGVLAAKYPDDATVHNCLAWARIGGGDIAGYADELRKMAAIRKEPKMLLLSRKIDEAVRSDPTTAHLVLIEDARRELANGERQTRMTPAFHASAMGDRPSLLALMSEAVNLGEQWQSVNLVNRIADKWKSDRQITALIERLRAPTPVANPD
jgi:tetratricopeptide (TPR) repeat protein